jgi:hypothetical protein
MGHEFDAGLRKKTALGDGSIVAPWHSGVLGTPVYGVTAQHIRRAYERGGVKSGRIA